MLKLGKIRKINAYYYTAAVLIATAISGLFFIGVKISFILSLILIPTVTGLTDIIVKRVRFGRWRYSPSAGITGLIIATVLSPISIYAQIIIGLIAILQKHIIKLNNRHIFNPAAFGLLFGWLVFGNAPAWWAFVSPIVFLFLFSSYLIGRLPLALTFYFVYGILLIMLNYFTNGALSANIFLNYPLLFFATVMVTEPKTSAITKKGMITEGVLLALAIFTIQRYFPIDLFIPMLLLANVLVYFRIIK